MDDDTIDSIVLDVVDKAVGNVCEEVDRIAVSCPEIKHTQEIPFVDPGEPSNESLEHPKEDQPATSIHSNIDSQMPKKGRHRLFIVRSAVNKVEEPHEDNKSSTDYENNSESNKDRSRQTSSGDEAKTPQETNERRRSTRETKHPDRLVFKPTLVPKKKPKGPKHFDIEMTPPPPDLVSILKPPSAVPRNQPRPSTSSSTPATSNAVKYRKVHIRRRVVGKLIPPNPGWTGSRIRMPDDTDPEEEETPVVIVPKKRRKSVGVLSSTTTDSDSPQPTTPASAAMDGDRGISPDVYYEDLIQVESPDSVLTDEDDLADLRAVVAAREAALRGGRPTLNLLEDDDEHDDTHCGEDEKIEEGQVMEEKEMKEEEEKTDVTHCVEEEEKPQPRRERRRSIRIQELAARKMQVQMLPAKNEECEKDKNVNGSSDEDAKRAAMKEKRKSRRTEIVIRKPSISDVESSILDESVVPVEASTTTKRPRRKSIHTVKPLEPPPSTTPPATNEDEPVIKQLMNSDCDSAVSDASNLTPVDAHVMPKRSRRKSIHAVKRLEPPPSTTPPVTNEDESVMQRLLNGDCDSAIPDTSTVINVDPPVAMPKRSRRKSMYTANPLEPAPKRAPSVTNDDPYIAPPSTNDAAPMAPSATNHAEYEEITPAKSARKAKNKEKRFEFIAAWESHTLRYAEAGGVVGASEDVPSPAMNVMMLAPPMVFPVGAIETARGTHSDESILSERDSVEVLKDNVASREETKERSGRKSVRLIRGNDKENTMNGAVKTQMVVPSTTSVKSKDRRKTTILSKTKKDETTDSDSSSTSKTSKPTTSGSANTIKMHPMFTARKSTVGVPSKIDSEVKENKEDKKADKGNEPLKKRRKSGFVTVERLEEPDAMDVDDDVEVVTVLEKDKEEEIMSRDCKLAVYRSSSEIDSAPYDGLVHVGRDTDQYNDEVDTVIDMCDKPSIPTAVDLSSYSIPSSMRDAEQSSVEKESIFDHERKEPEGASCSRFSEDQSDNIPWTDLSRPHCAEQQLGNDTVASHMRKWLKDWYKKLDAAEVVEEKKTKQPKKKRRKRTDSSSGGEDSDSDFSVGDESEHRLPNPLVLCGPVGCGKTAMISALAEELSFSVLESSPDERRSGTAIRARLTGAVSNHRMASARPGGISSFFAAKKPVDEVKVQKNNKKKHTLLVIEHVDVIFTDDDKGFWSAIAEIICVSKIPIVLTCNTLPDELHAILAGIESVSDAPTVFYMDHPSTQSTTTHVESLIFRATRVAPSRKFVEQIVARNRNDLRATINDVHLLTAADHYDERECKHENGRPSHPSAVCSTVASQSFAWTDGPERRREQLSDSSAMSLYASLPSKRFVPREDYDRICSDIINDTITSSSSCPSLSSSTPSPITDGQHSLFNGGGKYQQWVGRSEMTSDWLPYLEIIDSKEKKNGANNRRHQHYFNRVDYSTSTCIDPLDKLKGACAFMRLPVDDKMN